MSHLPGKNDVVEMLSMLVGQDVTAAPGRPLTWEGRELMAIGTYRSEDGKLWAACALDLPCSAGLGAALTLVPPSQARALVQKKELTPLIEENLHEIFNVASSWFHVEELPHVILHKVVVFPKDFVGNVANEIKGLKDRAAFELRLGDYGTGRIELLRAA
jgi:hypothetical protein